MIGAVLVPAGRVPVVVTDEMVRSMKPGAVIVDVAVDQGGCVETTHETTHSDPVYEMHGVLHYGVGNMPGAVPFTSTYALTNATLPYTLTLAERGVAEATARDGALANGVNTVGGSITHPIVAEALGKPHVTPADALDQAAQPESAAPATRGRSPGGSENRRSAPTRRRSNPYALRRSLTGPRGGRAGRGERQTRPPLEWTVPRHRVPERSRARDGCVNGARTRCRSGRDREFRERSAGGRRFALVQRVEDLFAVHLDFAWSLDPDAHLLTAHFEHGNHDVIPDHDALVGSPCEHEQPGTPSVETLAALTFSILPVTHRSVDVETPLSFPEIRRSYSNPFATARPSASLRFFAPSLA